MDIEEKTMQQLRGTSATLRKRNVVALPGQLVIESDTHQGKVGDGTTAYNALPYLGQPEPKELTESWESLRARIVAGDFWNIHIGDYKPITLTTGEVVIMEVAGIDQYYHCGDTVIGHHIDFISRDCLAGKRRMNATATNNGTASEPHPWRASELFGKLNNVTTGVFATLPEDLKPCIIEKRAVMEERYSKGGAVAADTTWSWCNAGKLWLPTEVEVFGHASWSDPGRGTAGGGCNRHYPIFPSHMIKCNGNGGSRVNWWTASACLDLKNHFCDVTGTGSCSRMEANDMTQCVPLCFRIG